MKKFGFGLMRLPVTDPQDSKSIDMETLCKMVDTFMEAGFNYFDTAYPYHEQMSEVAIRKALVERYPRGSCFQWIARVVFDNKFTICLISALDSFIDSALDDLKNSYLSLRNSSALRDEFLRFFFEFF